MQLRATSYGIWGVARKGVIMLPVKTDQSYVQLRYKIPAKKLIKVEVNFIPDIWYLVPLTQIIDPVYVSPTPDLNPVSVGIPVYGSSPSTIPGVRGSKKLYLYNSGIIEITFSITALKGLATPTTSTPTVVNYTTLGASNQLIGRVDARRGDKIWSYADVLRYEKNVYNVAAGNFNLSLTVPVPPNNVHIIENIYIRPLQENATELIIKINDGVNTWDVKRYNSWTANVGFNWTHKITLEAGENIHLRYIAAHAGDDFECWTIGYRMLL